ncbi:MAG: TatD family hydrolase [Acidimicrobiales bacterium]|jgi:TatD DNase family protein
MERSVEECGCSWFDSHCHLQGSYVEDGELTETLERATDAGVVGLVCVGTDAVSSAEAVSIARASKNEGKGESSRVPRVWSTIGIHPHEATRGTVDVAALLEEEMTARDGLVVGVGECGLDYYYEHSPRDQQIRVFLDQMALACKYDLALVIHVRDAWDDLFALLGSESLPSRVVVHCFSGGRDEAKRCLELGAFLSFSGIVTFKNAGGVREAAKLCPVDRLLVETDSPFLAPVPFRGKTNEPAWVSRVGEAVSEIKGIGARELSELTCASALEAFGISELLSGG